MFSEVIGQDQAVASLKKVIHDKRAKSFLFTGPSGTGKTTLSRIVANAAAGLDATQANISEIDAASNSGADAIREVVRQSIFRAIGRSPVKAYIIDEAHRLSSAAWTVLLKPMEEPPQHVYWFLCSTEPARIPKTIQTRCLSYALKTVNEDDLLELLVRVCEGEGISLPDEVLEAIADASGGSPRQALVFLESCSVANSAEQARRIMRTAAQAKEPIDLARLLIGRKGASWQSAVKIINSMGDVEAESIRIVVATYIAGALAKTRSETEAKNLLRVLEAFSKPYVQSDKLAPLFMSVGLALDLDR